MLIVGGGRDASWRERLDDTERYDAKANRFVASATMHVRRFKIENSVVRLVNGDVLVADARNLGAAVLLDDGSVLIARGYDSVDPLPTTETAQRYRT